MFGILRFGIKLLILVAAIAYAYPMAVGLIKDLTSKKSDIITSIKNAALR